MSAFFTIGDADDRLLLEKVMAEWHADLVEASVKVQLIMAARTDGAPAIRHGGYPALATVKVVALKDRLTKGYDAEMLVDSHAYDRLSDKGKRALFDHELEHLTLKRKKPTRVNPCPAVEIDDLGRPKLGTKKGDWNAGDGFAAVVARHGEHAIEFENLRLAYGYASAAADKGIGDGLRRAVGLPEASAEQSG